MKRDYTYQTLVENTCEVCHITILTPHPEKKFADMGYVKCGLCGYTKLYEPFKKVQNLPERKDD